MITKSVLIVDDDDMLRDTIAKGLRNAGFDAICAPSAEHANDILNKITIDAIVLDRMMGGMDGLSFLRQIRAKNNNTPVIMLTAMSGSENAIDGLSGGANDYMAKPFQLQELILRLNNIIKSDKRDAENTTKTIGLMFSGEDFFVLDNETGQKKLLSLSTEEKKLLQNLTNPVGNTVSATPMVVKRLRNKINGVLSDIDIITVRGMGYKIIKTKI